MTRALVRLAALSLAASVVILLTSCAPSREQLACERAGGDYVGYVVTYVLVGKVLTPIYAYRCDGV